MAIAWFVCNYKIRPHPTKAIRYCAMDDYTPLIIRQDSGDWRELEALGGYVVVKVRASQATLNTIAGSAGFLRIPLALLNDSLSTLTNAQRTAIRNRLLDMGYTSAEITAALGSNLALRTLGDLVRFASSRMRHWRLDRTLNQLVYDGTETQWNPNQALLAIEQQVT